MLAVSVGPGLLRSEPIGKKCSQVRIGIFPCPFLTLHDYSIFFLLPSRFGSSYQTLPSMATVAITALHLPGLSRLLFLEGFCFWLPINLLTSHPTKMISSNLAVLVSITRPGLSLQCLTRVLRGSPAPFLVLLTGTSQSSVCSPTAQCFRHWHPNKADALWVNQRKNLTLTLSPLSFPT